MCGDARAVGGTGSSRTSGIAEAVDKDRDRPIPTAAGRATTRRRAAARSGYSSRKWRAGTASATWSPTPRCRTTPKGAAKPALGTVKLEADTSVAVDERLVNFTNVKLTETHFSDAAERSAARKSSPTIDAARARSSALVIALDRVLARLDKSQIIPKNVDGVKADPPVIFYSTSPAVLVNLDGDPIWSPIKDNDLQFAVNTNWDLFEHAPTKTFYLRYDQSWLERRRHQGTVEAGGQAARQLREAARRRQLEGRQSGAARQALRPRGAQGVRQHDARGADPAARRAELPARDRHPAAVGEQHRQRRLPARQGRPGVLPGFGALVHARRIHRPVDVRDAEPAGRLQEDSALARAIARARVGAGHRRGGRSRAARADPADRARRQEAGQGARGAVPGRHRSSSRSSRRPSRGR